MSRTERLLDLIQLLRQHRYPVAGSTLAEKLGISLRTLYRDINTLQAQGASIQGEPGLGYVLKPGFMLPPLMFDDDEIEALVLGMRWVSRRADSQLKDAATKALSKIEAVLPTECRHLVETSGLLIGPPKPTGAKDEDETLIRQAIRKEVKLNIQYTDVKGETSERIIWPLALGFFEDTKIIVAWCELRQDFRHFRTDRIKHISALNERIGKRRQILLKQWRTLHNIPEQ